MASVPKLCPKFSLLLAVHAMPDSVISEVGESADSWLSIIINGHNSGLF